jgi:hypothetical protein
MGVLYGSMSTLDFSRAIAYHHGRLLAGSISSSALSLSRVISRPTLALAVCVCTLCIDFLLFGWVSFVLFYFVLFCFVLFCFVLFVVIV